MKKFFLVFYIMLLIPLISACLGSETTSKTTGGITAPAGVTASDGDYPTAILISWNTVSGASQYYIYRSTSATGTYTHIGTASAGYNSLYDKSTDASYPITLGSTYYYAVTALDSSSNESDSSSVDSGYSGLTATQAGVKFWNNSSTSTITGIYFKAGSTEPTTPDWTDDTTALATYTDYQYTTPVNYTYWMWIWFLGNQYIDWYVTDGTYKGYDDYYSAAYSQHLFAAGDCFTFEWGKTSDTYYNYDYYWSKSLDDKTIQGKEADFCVVQLPDGSFVEASTVKVDEK